MKKIFIVLSIVSFSLSVFAEMTIAQETVKKPESKVEKDVADIGAAEPKKKKRTPVQINADEAEFDDKAREVRYKGNVIVTDNGMNMTCEAMTVFLTEKKEITRILAREDVVIIRSVRNKEGKLEKMTAIADEAEYFQKEEKIILRGNAKLERGGDKIESPRITFYRNSSLVTTTGTNMVFNAETADELKEDDSEKEEAQEEKPAESTEEAETANPLLKPKKEEDKPHSNWYDDEDED